MDNQTQRQDIQAHNERSLKTLARAISLSQHQFALILVRCNYAQLRDRITQQLQARLPLPISILTLPESAKTLYTTIHTALETRSHDLHLADRPTLPRPATEPAVAPAALFIFGLETLQALEQALIATNIVREELRRQFQFPIVLWANDAVLRKLERLTPDLYSWAGNTIIGFELAPLELVRSLKDHSDRLFSAVLDMGDEQVWANQHQTRLTNALRPGEVPLALANLNETGFAIDPELEASLDFLLGQQAQAQGQMPAARDRYERSLEFWLQHLPPPAAPVTSPEPPAPLSPAGPHPLPPIPYLERAACVLFYLGLWWRTYAVLQRATYTAACQQALHYFERSLELFTQENRQDLVARFMIAQAETLQKLERWDELEALAKQALVLHKLYRDPVRQARDYGFLAETAIARQDWATAKQSTYTALQILRETETELDVAGEPLDPQLAASLDLAHRYHCNWYLYLLARAEEHLGNRDAAILHLETARDRNPPQSDPTLYIQILRHLRDLYFEQGKYLEAFRTRQMRRLIEHQYGYRAFVGALRLQPLTRSDPAAFPLPPPIDPKALLNQEIRASGRQQDLEKLRDRLTQAQYKLIVLHGPSGVGKSSIVNAGLVPMLAADNVEGRPFWPIVLDVYTDWQTSLERKLADGLNGLPTLDADNEAIDFSVFLNPPVPPNPPRDRAPETAPRPNPTTPPPFYSATLLKHLRAATDRNLLPVLIFDQFEEFFFEGTSLQTRRPFYYFLQDCLNQPFVKVVLTLREDYLHYLLEFQRLTNLDIINNDILGKEIRYPLGDLAPEEAKAVIKNLTDKAQFPLPDDLVEALVADLAGDLGVVRPIELQVVGAQLQVEGINTLIAYRQHGPKERLVQRFLEDAIKDCGPENEELARIVLYLLTNENGTRPLKTQDDLEADLIDLGLIQSTTTLNLVLEVLVGSGLVFLIPESPAACYQLVHDYLVSFIRSEQENEISHLQLELERERQKRQTVEEQLQRSEAQLLETREATRLRVRQALWALGTIAIAAAIIVLWAFAAARRTIQAAKTAEISAALASSSLASGTCIAQWATAASQTGVPTRSLKQCTYEYTVMLAPDQVAQISPELWASIRTFAPDATLQQAQTGKAVHLGQFQTVDGAVLLASYLQENGLTGEVVPLVMVAP